MDLDERNLQMRIDAGKAMTQAAKTAGAALGTLAVAMQAFGRAMVEVMWRSYVLAGAPYGMTKKGVQRWWSERDPAAQNQS